MKTNYVISVEIGSSKTKVGAAVYDPALGSQSPVTLVAVEQEALSNSVRYGRVQNVEEVTRKTQVALDRLAGRSSVYPRKIVGAYVALGGRSLTSVHTTVAMPLSATGETEITAATIETLKSQAENRIPENREVLKVIPVKYVLDGTLTSNPVGSFGRRIEAEFTVVVCDKSNIRNLNRVVYERLGLDLGLVVRPIAIADIALSVEDVRLGCMLVDFGAETTTVSIYKEGALQYLATIPMGSHHITSDLASGLGMIEEEAEKVKKIYGKAITEASETVTAEQRDIDNYVQARVSEIVANILAQITFAGYNYSDIRTKGIVVTGQGAQLRNFCHLLEMESDLPVRAATAPEYVHVADPSINLSENLDIAAICVEGARIEAGETQMPCVEEPEPEPVPDPILPEPEEPAPAEKEEPQGAGFDIDENPFGGAYADNDDTPRRRRKEIDDEDVLLDDSEAERRRKEREEKKEREIEAERRRQQAKIDELTEKLNREKKKKERVQKEPESDSRTSGNYWSAIKKRLEKLVNDVDSKGDGSDTDE